MDSYSLHRFVLLNIAVEIRWPGGLENSKNLMDERLLANPSFDIICSDGISRIRSVNVRWISIPIFTATTVCLSPGIYCEIINRVIALSWPNSDGIRYRILMYIPIRFWPRITIGLQDILKHFFRAVYGEWRLVTCLKREVSSIKIFRNFFFSKNQSCCFLFHLIQVTSHRHKMPEHMHNKFSAPLG